MKKSETFSIRLTALDLYRLNKIQELRSHKLQETTRFLNTQESYAEIIKNGICRMYNETLDYFMWEDEMFSLNETLTNISEYTKIEE